MPTFDIRCIIPGAETDGALVGFEQRTDPGEGPPRHTHREQIEIFHIIDGEYVFEMDGERTKVSAGDRVIIPAGVKHAFKNVGATSGRVHFDLLPALNDEEFFERVVKEFDEIEDHATFFDAYGMNLDGPPLD